MPSIIFICTHNSARSQMAEGLMRHYYGDAFEALSAGTHPDRVNPLAIEALAKLDIDISKHRSESVDHFRDRDIDYVITVCDDAQENCPYLPARIANRHHRFSDPSRTPGSHAQKLAAFCQIRDEIKVWLDSFVLEHKSGIAQ